MNSWLVELLSGRWLELGIRNWPFVGGGEGSFAATGQDAFETEGRLAEKPQMIRIAYSTRVRRNDAACGLNAWPKKIDKW